MDGRFRARPRLRARQTDRGRGLPIGPADRACRPGLSAVLYSAIFSVYNSVDEKPAQCTIRRQDRTLSRSFKPEIVHIEVFMPMDDAKGARGHCLRPDSNVTDKSPRSALPSTPLAGAEKTGTWRRRNEDTEYVPRRRGEDRASAGFGLAQSTRPSQARRRRSPSVAMHHKRSFPCPPVPLRAAAWSQLGFIIWQKLRAHYVKAT